MGKFYETSSTFEYTIDQVLKAFWSRYPNPFSAHVLSEDTLFRELRGGQLYSRRLITKINRLPRLGHLFVKSKSGNTTVSVVEESYVDPDAKTITTYTRNICYTRILNIIEKVTYSRHPQDPSQTMAHRSAWIDSGVYGFRRAIESFGVEKFKKSAVQAVNGFNWILNRIYSNGVVGTSILPEGGGHGRFQIVKQKARMAGEKAKGSIRMPVYAAPAKEKEAPPPSN